ncbi:dihydrodipicolinate synthase family protein [bacterium]|nr:dihydrodipicolinate synthase family protein [bacterium]
MVERQFQGGTQKLMIGGTTEEGHLMNWDKHTMLIAHTINRMT